MKRQVESNWELINLLLLWAFLFSLIKNYKKKPHRNLRREEERHALQNEMKKPTRYFKNILRKIKVDKLTRMWLTYLELSCFWCRHVSDQWCDSDFCWRYYSETSSPEELESGSKRLNNKYPFEPTEGPLGTVTQVWVYFALLQQHCRHTVQKVFGIVYRWMTDAME